MLPRFHVVSLVRPTDSPCPTPRGRRTETSPAKLREGAAENDVAVTYWMNRLQGIDDDKPGLAVAQALGAAVSWR
jgi:hypothetical protein